jgi:transcriptional regulator with XRE-family HTH domain
MTAQVSIGTQLREWRLRRRATQLDLALDAGISARHLSFIENGRAQPSRAMLLQLFGELDIPLRERNALLMAAGYAPIYAMKPWSDAALQVARTAVESILTGHEPYPALLLDRHWNLVMANNAVLRLMTGIDASLLTPPVNVLRLSLHPLGLASRIVNFAQWRDHLLERLARQVALTNDAELAELFRELRDYPAPPSQFHVDGTEPHPLVIQLELRTEAGLLNLFSTTTMFGTAVEVTLSELVLEAFYPADAVTADILRSLQVSDR